MISCNFMLRQLAQALLNRRVTLLSASAAFAGMHSNQSPTLKACSPLVAPGSVPAPTKPGYTTTLTHIFVPEETNPSGNVHGGSILKHIEQAGWLAAARHCASSGVASPPPACATARLEHIDFWAPVFTGNVAEFQARVTFTSKRSMRVHVDVWAEDVVKGTRVLTNAASLWYVALDKSTIERPYSFASSSDAHPGFVAVDVPPFTPLSPQQADEFEEGRQLYEMRCKKVKESAQHDAHVTAATWKTSTNPDDAHTPAGSAVQLVQITLPSDCVNYNRSSPVAGGFLMKLMDNAAGMCAAKYCHTNVVTASIDTIDFLHAVRNGQLVYALARPTFASAKSLEVEVLVEVEDMSGARLPAAHAYFTFVSLDDAHKPLAVPTLKLQGPDDVVRWQQGKQRYEVRRAQRQAKQHGVRPTTSEGKE